MTFATSDNADIINLSRINPIGANFQMVQAPSSTQILHCNGAPILCVSFGWIKGFDLGSGRVTSKSTHIIREIRFDLMAYQHERLISLLYEITKNNHALPNWKGSLSFSTSPNSKPCKLINSPIFVLFTTHF